MQRRKFLQTSSLASLTIGSIFNTNAAKAENDAVSAPATAFDLTEKSITDLQQLMRDKKYTSRQLVEMYLKRIQTIDKAGPKLNAVIELNPDALILADQLDKERASGKVRGPLHGIPVLIKDNISTGDRMHTTAGAMALADNIYSKDAFIVTKLRDAGAVILGKTNLSEWANFRSNHSTSAWSSRGGQTKNPYVLDRNPSGSSSGSGAAVAASLCAIAIGTETNGSIVSPSSVNGLVGIKPTVGLWSRSHIIPISKTQDTAGPMARTVKDAAILLGALTGTDAQDLVTQESEGKAKKDYTIYLKTDGLQGKRLGLEKSALQGSAAAVALLKEAVEVLKSKGATIVEVDLMKEIRQQTGNASFQVLLYEFKDGVNNYLKGANSKMKSLDDVIAFNRQNEAKAMPFFKQETLEMANQKGDLNSAEYLEALKKSNGLSRTIIDNMLKENNLDAIIGPTNGFAVCIDLINGDYNNGFSFSSPAAMARYPHITVPMGQWHDLPMGLSFFSTAWHEPQLLAMAYAYEQASKKRKAPQFKSPIVV
ncbi:amidase [Mucilaginibacter sp. RS28]|uniref:Amidase n=1 Tax=Mucilaginibacter straminoryzae TaxID=2932774 RepID=A0A9X2B7N8_9SPHI|nr:amidase [Mucilaginibacter straminoryzae]MCJ8208531.1 amidase [Mucilaginibacter straminoryzae]